MTVHTPAITGSLPHTDYQPLGIIHASSSNDDPAQAALDAVDGLRAIGDQVEIGLIVIDVQVSVTFCSPEFVALASGTLARPLTGHASRFARS